MFSRKKHADDAHAPAEEPAVPTASGKKGRPTPTRKQAQARNNRPLVPADRKEAKRRASQARNARFRAEQEALITGDEQHLPARDNAVSYAQLTMPTTRLYCRSRRKPNH